MVRINQLIGHAVNYNRKNLAAKVNMCVEMDSAVFLLLLKKLLNSIAVTVTCLSRSVR